MPPKHYSNELLLAYLDNELPPAETRAVLNHLSCCWRCRAQAGELEHQIQKIAQEFSTGAFPDSWQIAQAKDKFLRWRDSYDRGLSSVITFAQFPRTFPSALAACLAGLFAAALGISIWLAYQPSPPVVLARALAMEEAYITRPGIIHEAYQVEITRTSPQIFASKARLEIWSEPVSNRFAWHLKDEGNRLKFAEWNPSSKEHYIFNQKMSAAVASKAAFDGGAASLAETVAPLATSEDLNTAFVGWVRNQRWHLIAFARDFASFSNRDGIALSMRRVRTANGHQNVVLEATRGRGDKRITLMLEVDATGRPIAEVARVSTGQSSVELRLVGSQVESVSAVPALSAVFRPEVPIADGTRFNLFATAKPPPGHRARTQESSNSALVDSTEIQVEYVLHRAGLCLGAPIAITRVGNSRNIHVTGIVENEQVKEQVASAILQLPAAKLVYIDLKTPEEAAAQSRSAQSSSADILPAGSLDSSSTLAIEKLIDESSLAEDEKYRLKTKLAVAADGLISTTETLLQEAWALNRLSQRFPTARIEGVPGESSKLVAKMIREHLVALNHQLSQIKVMTLPLGGVAAAGAVNAAGVRSKDHLEPDLNSAFARLVTIAEQINRDSQSLFAFGNSSPASPKQSAGDLIEALSVFEEIFNEANNKSMELDPANAVFASGQLTHESLEADRSSKVETRAQPPRLPKPITEIEK